MTRTLVVGARSPLGRAVRAALVERDHVAVGTSRAGTDGTYVLDIADPASSRRALEAARPEVVIYMARPDLPEAHVDRAVSSAVASLSRFAMECRDAGVLRVLFASSSAVYGTTCSRPVAEADATPAPGPYADLKLQSEHALAEAARRTGLTAVSFRIFNVYGPGFSHSLVNRLHAASAGGPEPRLYESDEFVRDYVHAQDVAAIFAVAASVPDLGSTVLNVGTGIGTSNMQLISLIPDARWKPAGHLQVPSVSIADVTRLREHLGLTPSTRLAEGVGLLT